jgi:hypothetical protein
MMRPVGVKTRLFRVSESDGLEKAWSISRPIFSVPPLSGAHESCLVDDSRVGRFVPESAKPRISSESDSAALAPLQQDFCVSKTALPNRSGVDTPKSVQRSLRECSLGVWRRRVSLGRALQREAQGSSFPVRIGSRPNARG